MDELIIDVAGHTSRLMPVASDTASKRRASSSTEATRLQDEATHRAAVVQARPPDAVIQKWYAGTTLTADELQQAVRWLGLKVAGPPSKRVVSQPSAR